MTDKIMTFHFLVNWTKLDFISQMLHCKDFLNVWSMVTFLSQKDQIDSAFTQIVVVHNVTVNTWYVRILEIASDVKPRESKCLQTKDADCAKIRLRQSSA